ncbi:MAG: type II toxin-antitoxin system RelE/ParE family toxin [Acidobacteriota bacterium]
MKKCIFSRPAQKDFQNIYDYIAEIDEDAALDFTTRLQLMCDNLAKMPQMGRARDDLKKGLRSFFIESYVIFYQITGTDIQIIRVLHSARNIERIFSKR